MLVYFWLLRRLFARIAFVVVRSFRFVPFRTFARSPVRAASAALLPYCLAASAAAGSVSASARASASASACRAAPRTNCFSVRSAFFVLGPTLQGAIAIGRRQLCPNRLSDCAQLRFTDYRRQSHSDKDPPRTPPRPHASDNSYSQYI